MIKPLKGWAKALLILSLLGIVPASLAGELAATVDWGKRLGMGTLVPGVVQRVEVSPGQRVEAGASLLALDQKAYRARLRAAEADARRARILLDEARLEFERAQELFDRTVLSKHDLMLAEIGLRTAEAETAAANAGVVAARSEMAYSELQAPFGGIVIEVRAEPGQAVNAESGVPELLVLVDDRTLKVKALADAGSLAAILAADAVRVKLDGRELVASEVRPGFESMKNVQGQELFAVIAVVERPDDLVVRSGQSARILW